VFSQHDLGLFLLETIFVLMTGKDGEWGDHDEGDELGEVGEVV